MENMFGNDTDIVSMRHNTGQMSTYRLTRAKLLKDSIQALPETEQAVFHIYQQRYHMGTALRLLAHVSEYPSILLDSLTDSHLEGLLPSLDHSQSLLNRTIFAAIVVCIECAD